MRGRECLDYLWPELAAGRRKVRLQREVSTALARVELVVGTEEGGPTPTPDHDPDSMDGRARYSSNWSYCVMWDRRRSDRAVWKRDRAYKMRSR